MVYIPEEDRGTLCISSQVGCALDCSFCSTAQQGFNRNLTTAEIVGQVWLANRELGWQVGDNRIITNIVLMGMGEPLANFRNVVPAIRIFLDDLGLRHLAPPRHAVHLGPRAADLQARRRSELRARGVAARAERRAAQPARADQPQAQHRRVAEACWHYLDEQNGRSVTFEYVMLDGVNDQPEHARELAQAAARQAGQAQSHSVQSVPRHALPPLARGGDREIPRRAHPARAHRHHPQDARRRHRCGLRTARRPGHRPHHRAAGLENLRLAGARMNTRWIAVLSRLPARGLCHQRRQQAAQARRPDRTRPPRPTSSSASPTCSRATTRSRGKSSSARSSRTRRIRTCTPASRCCTTASASPSSPTSISAKRCAWRPTTRTSRTTTPSTSARTAASDEGVERFAAVAANKYYRTPEVALTNAGVCLRGAKRLDEAQQHVRRRHQGAA